MERSLVAIVTGAGGGIGQAISLTLAKNGFRLLLTGRDLSKLSETKKLCEDVRGETISSGNIASDSFPLFPADLASPTAPKQIVERALSEFGQIDLLVNNAGASWNAPISEFGCDEFDLVFHTNVRAPFLLCKEAIPHMKKSTLKTIINIGSVVGYKGYENQSLYGASKHALRGFTKVLAKEHQKDGFRVHLISPGGVNTKMATAMRPDIETEALIQVEEIAEIVQFLITSPGKAMIDEIKVRREGAAPWA